MIAVPAKLKHYRAQPCNPNDTGREPSERQVELAQWAKKEWSRLLHIITWNLTCNCLSSEAESVARLQFAFRRKLNTEGFNWHDAAYLRECYRAGMEHDSRHKLSRGLMLNYILAESSILIRPENHAAGQQDPWEFQRVKKVAFAMSLAENRLYDVSLLDFPQCNQLGIVRIY